MNDIKDYRIVINSEFTSKPIISYGLIIYARDTERWLLTRRRHSIEFLLIIKGNYRISYLAMMIKNLTHNEVAELRKALYEDGYFEKLCIKMQLDVFHSSKLIFNLNRNILIKLLDKNTNSELKWTWPKGRLNNKEQPFDCALREFSEEVECSLPQASYISSTYIQDINRTYSSWILENRYWLYVVENEFEIEQPNDNIEVSERKWCDTNECLSHIRHNGYFDEILNLVRLLK